jgi:ferredoxin
MDAVVGMEGAGPQHGSPRHIGLILASKSCTALDVVATAIAGFEPMKVPTVKKAYERGIGPSALKEVTIFGEPVEPHIMKDFKKPSTMSMDRIPPFLLNGFRRFVSGRPRINSSKCVKCGICARDCPPKAIKFSKGAVPVIDHGKCIRCYCCQELCPEGAVYVARPLVRRLLNR